MVPTGHRHLHLAAPYWDQAPFSAPPPGPPDGDDDDDPDDGHGDDENQDEEERDATPRRDRQRVREADEVKILSFPQGTAWRAWRANTIHAIVSAAGRHDDKALEWVMRVETHTSAELENP